MASPSSRSRSSPKETSTASLLSSLSLSPARPNPRRNTAEHTLDTPSPPPLPRKSRSRVSAGEELRDAHRGRRTIGGPSYETLASNRPSPPPKLHIPTSGPARQPLLSESPSHTSGRRDLSQHRTPSTGYNDYEARSPPTHLVNRSPPRARQPIYPALASPPRHKTSLRSSTATSEALAAVSPIRDRDVGQPWSYPTTQPPDPSDIALRTSNPAPKPSSSPQRGTLRAQRGPSPVSPTRNRSNVPVIASSSTNSPNQSPNATAASSQPYRYDREGRPMISARKSAASSSKTVTRLDRDISPPLPSPSTRTRAALISDGPSEASAYARAMTSSFPRSPSMPQVGKQREATEIESSRADRPLPRPPGESPGQPRHISSADHGQSVSRAQPGNRISPGATLDRPPQTTVSDSTMAATNGFNDPEQSVHPASGVLLSNGPPSLRPDQAPTFLSADPSSYIALEHSHQPISRRSNDLKAVNGTPLLRKPGRVGLDFVLGHPVIQSTLLGQLGINSFLSLSGSSEDVRRQFTGEAVGRWVLREWAVEAPDMISTRWPNLTVWEGFLESLLHDPATYSTYPARWHNLLRHLSLSHTLVVLYLRGLPSSCFPNHSLLPFEDDGFGGSLPFSASSASLSSLGQPRSRVGSIAGSDAGSVTATKPPKRERVIEIVMPEPLAAQPQTNGSPVEVKHNPARRRGSISSLASAASLSFGRRRSNSLAAEGRPSNHMHVPLAEAAASMAPGKAALPPVSYPSAKRYGFRNASDVPIRRRTATDSRPGSLYSFQTGPSNISYAPRLSRDMRNLGSSDLPLAVPPPIGVRPRSSFGSADSFRRSDVGSPASGRRPVGHRSEPAFDKPLPFIPGRAPVLRVFVPLSERVRRWPSAEGAFAAVEELEKCGALKRMRLGDLVVNTAISSPRTTEHVLLFVPFVKHLLVPLQYSHLSTGHLPSYVDAFALPPSYYFPFLPTPQIIFLNLGPYREQGLHSMRLASDRRDMTVSSGARISAKRYLYVAGVEIGPGNKAAPEWHGMVSLEAEGTAEGKAEMVRRFGTGPAAEAPLAPWEVVKEKSMGGTVWLRVAKSPV